VRPTGDGAYAAEAGDMPATAGWSAIPIIVRSAVGEEHDKGRARSARRGRLGDQAMH